MSDFNIDKSDYKKDTRVSEQPPVPPPPPAPSSKEHSRFLLLMLAFLPGLGHMYLGFIRRGLFYLSSFAFAIFVTVQFGVIGFVPFIVLSAFGIVGVLTVAFFESLVIRRDLALGKELEDTIPAFVKTKTTLAIVAAFLLVPFLINLVTSLSWYAWVILLLIFVIAIMFFSKKSK